MSQKFALTLPKPPFVALIERNYHQSKINASYVFPRTQIYDLNDSDNDIVGVYNLNQQNMKKTTNSQTIEVRSRTRRVISLNTKDQNLSVKRVKTEIEEPKQYRLPKIMKLKPLNHLRSISQTSMK